MQIKIGKFDPATGTVPATFTDGEKTHSRAVNAVVTNDGSYDRAATKTRMEQVAAGVAHKFALGLLGTGEAEVLG